MPLALSPARRTAGLINVEDARRHARRRVPRAVFDFVDGGAEDELTLAANRRAFQQVEFRPRMAVDIPAPDLSTTVLGQPVSSPILFAPCGLMGTVHPAAEPAVARVATQRGTIAAFSTFSSRPLEEIARASTGQHWFQLYFLGGRDGARSLVDRAQSAGYRTLVVTVDTATTGRRERDLRNGVRYPLTAGVREAVQFFPQVVTRPGWLYRFIRAGMPLAVANSRPVTAETGGAPSSIIEAVPTWADLAWIRERWDGPVVVKGIMTGHDTRRAIEAGADAVIVSNHGGRQLDGAPGSLRMLPEVVAAAGGEAEVLVDGGVRRGSDVVKALALGARAVLIGRPYLYGLAAGGEQGIARVLDMLTDELTRAMQLVGCPAVSQLDHSWIIRPAPVVPPGPLPVLEGGVA